MSGRKKSQLYLRRGATRRGVAWRGGGAHAGYGRLLDVLMKTAILISYYLQLHHDIITHRKCAKRVRVLVHTHTHQYGYNMHARHAMDGEHTMRNT
jgi:hypothetical protein